jgi:Transcriptional regulator DsbA
MLANMNPNDKVKLIGALKDMSISMARMDAERDLQKNIKNDICKELDLNKKVFSKLAKTYHKQNFSEEVQLHQEFETLYASVTANKNP